MSWKKKKRLTSGAIERAAKRQAQKEAGALDGRYRTRVVRSKKTFKRKKKHVKAEE